jgi:hypothetical protein
MPENGGRMRSQLDPVLALEAKAIVALAFRNGPIEDVHAGKSCPACSGSEEYSHITDEQMKAIMKSAVNKVYSLLRQRDHDMAAYAKSFELASRYTLHWDDPEV